MLLIRVHDSGTSWFVRDSRLRDLTADVKKTTRHNIGSAIEAAMYDHNNQIVCVEQISQFRSDMLSDVIPSAREQLDFTTVKVVGYANNAAQPENYFLNSRGEYVQLSRAHTFKSFRAAAVAAANRPNPEDGSTFTYMRIHAALQEIVRLFLFREHGYAAPGLVPVAAGCFRPGYVVLRDESGYDSRFIGWRQNDDVDEPGVVGRLAHSIAFRDLRHAQYMAAALNRHGYQNSLVHQWGVLYRHYSLRDGEDYFIPPARAPINEELMPGFINIQPDAKPFPIPVGSQVLVRDRTYPLTVVAQFHDVVFVTEASTYLNTWGDSEYTQSAFSGITKLKFSAIVAVAEVVVKPLTRMPMRAITLEDTCST